MLWKQAVTIAQVIKGHSLGKVPSALSYTIQKLEEALDINILDRSEHKATFTQAGLFLLAKGKGVLSSVEDIVSDIDYMSNDWEPNLRLVVESVVPASKIFPLLKSPSQKSKKQFSIQSEVLLDAWDKLENGEADIIIAPNLKPRLPPKLNLKKLYSENIVYIAAPEHCYF